MAADTLISSNEQILDLLKESATSKEKSHEMIELRMQNEAKWLALKENKILLKFSFYRDINTCECIYSEKERIVRKRLQEQQQQPSSVTQNLFRQYFKGFEASRENLPDY